MITTGAWLPTCEKDAADLGAAGGGRHGWHGRHDLIALHLAESTNPGAEMSQDFILVIFLV
ncbi:hypothetical protein ACLK19_28030 [Escherichia coli]